MTHHPRLHTGRGFGGSLWLEDEPGEDPTIFEDDERNIHIIFHGYQWQGLWTGMHAYSADGNVFQLSQRRDGRGAFSTNQSYSNCSANCWDKYYRRERPEIHLDSEGNPSIFYTGIEFGENHPQKQYSYSTVNRVRGGTGLY